MDDILAQRRIWRGLGGGSGSVTAPADDDETGNLLGSILRGKGSRPTPTPSLPPLPPGSALDILKAMQSTRVFDSPSPPPASRASYSAFTGGGGLSPTGGSSWGTTAPTAPPQSPPPQHHLKPRTPAVSPPPATWLPQSTLREAMTRVEPPSSASSVAPQDAHSSSSSSSSTSSAAASLFSSGDVEGFLRKTRMTPVARRVHLAEAAAGRGGLTALMAILPNKTVGAVRELGVDILTLRHRIELVTSRLREGSGGSSSDANTSTTSTAAVYNDPPPLVLLELQDELLSRKERLLALAGGTLGEAILHALCAPENEGAARRFLNLPAIHTAPFQPSSSTAALPSLASLASSSSSSSSVVSEGWGEGASGVGGSTRSGTSHHPHPHHGYGSRVVANSVASVKKGHDRDMRATVDHIMGVVPQMGWGGIVAPLGTPTGGGDSAASVSTSTSASAALPRHPNPHVSRSRFAPPLPPQPSSSLAVDGILPDGTRDLWGLAAKARSTAITGVHLGGGGAGGAPGASSRGLPREHQLL